MGVDTTNFVFPLEDKFIDKVELYDDGFYYAKEVLNGAYVKAPFDCVVKRAAKTGEKGVLPWTFAWDPDYDVYKMVYESKDKKYQFSVTDILPNDRSRNIGESFKAGENIGRVLSAKNGFAYTFYESQVVNPEAPAKEQKREFSQIEADEVQQNTSESVAEEKEANSFKMPSNRVILAVAVFGLTVFYIAKRYK